MKLPIEINAKRGSFLGMSAAHFLRNYWQKRPLLIRQAFPNYVSPLHPNDLAGLACEESANARLVLHEPKRDRWTLRHGPFNETDFKQLPKSHWTLLVQDVDKWDADVGVILQCFRFLPDWRIDDIMVSYAVDHGSVGAHVDNYDVFLLQGMGSRRWRISVDPKAPKDFRDDAELKLLRHFSATHEWLLEPGDMLYLPPGIAHHGIAQGESLTFSLGMRAPSHAEMLIDFAEYLAEQIPEEHRYIDPDLTISPHPAEIDDATMVRVQNTLKYLQTLNTCALRHWFGGFITRYRSAQIPMPRPRKLSAAALEKRFAQGTTLIRNPWARFAYYRTGSDAQLVIAGQRYRCSLKLAQILGEVRALDISVLRKLNTADKATLLTLINDGHFGFDS